MPELPEVETTTNGLRKEVLGLKITDVWTDLNTKDKRKNDTVANPTFFKIFKKEVIGVKIISAERRAKNILINLSNGKTILVHMKMTGYLFYGSNSNIKYAHVIFNLSNKKFLVFSDARKFGKITLLDTKRAFDSKHLKHLGPEPLTKGFTLAEFIKRLKLKPHSKIKTVLMDQAIIAGIGNIYSDEILWASDIHPERKVEQIKEKEFLKIYKNMQKILTKGIHFGGDSMSDYLNLYGLPGKFQLHHNVYQRKGEKYRKKNCKGIIERKIINGRSAHFCSVHQI